MKLPGYYSSGQFARLAGVSVRTIRYYDKQNILNPSYVNPSGARFYTDSDLARLQQILLLTYLGFSLDDIREMTIGDTDYHVLKNSLNLQKRLVQDRIEQMQLMESAIEDTVRAIEEEHQIDWSHMLELIHLTGMEKSLKLQYQNATNISARIRLHRDHSANRQGWFPWIYTVSNHRRYEDPGAGLRKRRSLDRKSYPPPETCKDHIVRHLRRHASGCQAKHWSSGLPLFLLCL